MKEYILGFIGIFLIMSLITPIAFAKVLPNKGSDISAEKVSEKTTILANQNAAFNRMNNGECIYALYNGIPVGPYMGESFEVEGTLEICGWVFFGSYVDFIHYLNQEYK